MLKLTEQQIIEDLLESDDELPSEYNEIPDIPAYQNDMRFDTLKYNWIDSNFSKYYSRKQENRNVCLSTLYSLLNEDIVFNKTENLKMGQKSLILKGTLNQDDIYCIKSVEPITSDTTFLWFINFLIYKDLQSNLTFMKTCLAPAIHEIYANPVANLDDKVKKFNFDIITTE